MDENPYRSPREAGAQLPHEPDDWPARVRRWAVGPGEALPWLVVASLLALLAAALVA
ncbi:MAG TPA: hypothetical protein VHC22_00200 [Pirellulales bacterium]|nr:hypothetical protein [Pirellulales bacterium]